MITSLVVTVVGPDRPGLVNAISDKAALFGVNWADSLMANLAGQFAGILHLQVPSANAEALIAALQTLESANMHIVVTRATSAKAATTPTRRIMLALVGHDHPGIIHTISRQLAANDVSIEKLTTQISSGAMSGEQMFHMDATLVLPNTLSDDALRAALEGIANDLMVDISLAAPSATG